MYSEGFGLKRLGTAQSAREATPEHQFVARKFSQRDKKLSTGNAEKLAGTTRSRNVASAMPKAQYNTTALARFQNNARDSKTTLKRKKASAGVLGGQRTQMMADSYELSVESQLTSRKAEQFVAVNRMFSYQATGKHLISPTSGQPTTSKKRKQASGLKRRPKKKSGKSYTKHAENKENLPDNHQRGEIIIVPNGKHDRNVNVLRKLSPNAPLEDPSMSEKSISEGFHQHGIPDSKILNNKNKFSQRVSKRKKEPTYKIATASIQAIEKSS